MAIFVRFAPSPTGLLHLGNTRTALLNWLFCRQKGGKFLLRLDDTDPSRSQEIYTEALLEDLDWLGLSHDTFIRQSSRLEVYGQAIAKLRQAARLYPCYETLEELEAKRRLQTAKGKPPIYDRAALKLTGDDKKRLEAEGKKPHFRFFLTEADVKWTDLIRGDVHYHTSNLSDPVLVREDGSPVYTLASVVDDLDLGITHILRGEDHVTNTAIQIQLIEALGGDPVAFTFGHVPLIVDRGGQGFSKRLGSLSLRELRKQGVDPLAICTVLAALGTADAPQVCAHIDDLVEGFDLGKFGRASPKLDLEEIWHINAKLLHHMPYEVIKDRLKCLKGLGLPPITPAFWSGVKGNLTRLEDLKDWWNICYGNFPPAQDEIDVSYLQKALDLLPPPPWTEETWSIWTQRLKEQTGRTGKNLYGPLRLALTGMHHGPEMKRLLPLMDFTCVKARLTREK